MKVGTLVYHPERKVYGIVIEAATYAYAREPPVLWVKSRWFDATALRRGVPSMWVRAGSLVHVGEAGTLPRS